MERRGELSEEETRGLTADRAVAPLMTELECMEVRRSRGEEEGGALWSADDILSVTLGALLCLARVVLVLASVARHVYSTIHHAS